ncbi:hypothetical protein AGMMS50256_03750 [Betaproteobacteria bacterium]|nr:hypothetical protein AGMMS50256_03750 [Betaproteobacteria bacterium]
MRNISVLGAAIALVALAGCATPHYSDVPTPTRYEKSRQQKLTAADHWRLIADNFAQQISADLQQKNGGQALYITPAGKKDGDFAFVEGFRELLTTALVNQGWVVRTSPQNAMQVDIRYSAYAFQPDRSTYYYGEMTALAAGLWAVGGIATAGSSTSAVAAGAKIVSISAFNEAYAWLLNGQGQDARGPVPSTEILLTASVTYDDQIVARRSNIYYVADEDSALYWNKRDGGAELRVKGGE